MIKKILVFGILVFFFVACGNNSNNSPSENDTTELNSTELSLLNFDSLASNFVGKEVTVSGIVDHVCKKGGKKILLVDGDNMLHVFSDKRFDEALSGNKVTVTGIVQEERVDSVYLAEKLNHEKETKTDDTKNEKEQLMKMTEYIHKMMDSLKNSGLDHFSNYSLKFESLKENK